ncbi:MAG: ribonuclease HII [Vicingaceae bacterium]
MLKSHLSEHLEAGCDEAGRGCLAGPVVAAAVILPRDFPHELINDSKKLSERRRDELRPIIEERSMAWSIGVVDHLEIDRLNILNASIEAMHRAIAKLKHLPELLLIDGNRFHPFRSIPHQCVIGGDAKYSSIAAASILAKTHRDGLMQALHIQFPDYGWNHNKGYPTRLHREAIADIGPSSYHRSSFKLLKTQGNLFEN